MMTYKDMPPEHQPPAEWRDKILHVRLIVGSAVLMGSDAPPNRYETPQACPCRSKSRGRRKRSGYSTPWRRKGR
jgi:uncharacterized glyoxalase superfamily protein PhnB